MQEIVGTTWTESEINKEHQSRPEEFRDDAKPTPLRSAEAPFFTHMNNKTRFAWGEFFFQITAFSASAAKITGTHELLQKNNRQPIKW